MKKKSLHISIFIFILAIVFLMVTIGIEYHFSDFFKPTVYLDFDTEEIKYIDFCGVPPKMKNPDQEYAIYSDLKKKERIFDYLKTIPLVEVERSEFPDMSPCCAVYFKNYELETVEILYLYGSLFICKVDSDKLYRVKYNIMDIIGELEELEL